MITPQTRISEIRKLPQFANCIDYVIGGPPGTDMALEDFHKFAPFWLIDGIADGLNFLADHRFGFETLDAPGTCLFDFTANDTDPFVLLCAGGAYMGVASFVEAFPTVQALRERGISCYVMQYRTGPAGGREKPLEDVACALKRIFARSSERPYVICGYSAGGHLAAAFATGTLGWERYGLPRPQAVWLAYPVISMDENAHAGSRDNFLLDQKNDPEARRRWSIDRQVTSDYPPTYIWHCEKDAEVTPEYNAIPMEAALRANKVPVKRSSFPGDAHGWGRAKGTAAEVWVDEAVSFWRENS